DALGLFVFWADDEIPAPYVFYAARLGHRCGDINDRWQRLDRSSRTDLFHVVHTILQAQHERVRSEQRSQRARRSGVVRGLHTKKHDLRAASETQIRGSVDRHTFLELQGIEE